ncbi:MAG TPA: nucleotidyltransferase domain-containing protein [Rickettsia endosymbiont of Pyrocoelia pectoralis]|nr:nucleotidyltransferase domain-containing protein [Rickettsia endosymbiont of Pyrocoelia pectoralis]
MKKILPKRSLKVQDRINYIVQQILTVAKDKIAMIILYGSYARGDWVQDVYIEGHITYSYIK